MNQHQLQIILEAQNNAAPVINGLKSQLGDLERAAKRANEAMQFRASASGSSAAPNANQAARQAAAAQKKAADDAYRAWLKSANDQFRAHQKAVADKKAADQAYLRWVTTATNQYHAQQQRQIRETARAQEKATRDAARAQREAERDAQRRQRELNRLLPAGLSSTSSVLGTLNSAGNTINRFLSSLRADVGMVLNVGQALGNSLSAAFRDAEKYALVAVGGVTALGAAVAKAGVEFNQLKQNTMLSLETITGSARQAQRIFDFSFKLSLPAKFTAEEILTSARTLEAFGLHLDQYGQRAGRYLTDAVALAQGMGKPLEQVARLVGVASTGRFSLQQMSALGISRPDLARHGVEFNANNSPRDRTRILPALLETIEERFPGIIEKMTNSYEARLDSMISMTRMFSGKVTEGLFESLGTAYKRVADFFQSIVEGTAPQGVMNVANAIRRAFDLIGKGIETAAEHLTRVMEFIGRFVNEDTVTNGLAQVIGLVKTLWNELTRFVGAATGRRSLAEMWDTFKNAAVDALDVVYRTWNGIMAVLDGFSKDGGKVWDGFKAGAETVMKVVKTIVGVQVLQLLLSGGKNLLDLSSTFARTPVLGRGGVGTMQMGMGFSLPGGGGSGDPMPGGFNFWDMWRANLPFATDHRKASEIALEWGRKHPQRAAWLQRQGDGMPTPSLPERVLDGAARAALQGAGFKLGPGAALDGGTDLRSLLGDIAGLIQGVGDKAIGLTGDAFSATAPDGLKNLLGNVRSNFTAGYNGKSLRSFMAEMDAETASAKAALTRALTGGAAAPRGDGYAPGSQLYRNPAGSGGFGPELPPLRIIELLVDEQERMARESGGRRDERESRLAVLPALQMKLQAQLADIQEKRSDYDAALRTGRSVNGQPFQRYGPEMENLLKAQSDAAKTRSLMGQIRQDAGEARYGRLSQDAGAGFDAARSRLELLPESQQAQAAARELVPQLQAQQRLIQGRMGEVLRGTYEYARLEDEYWKKAREINDIREKAADVASRQAFDAPRRQFSTLKRLIGLLPEGSRGRAGLALLGPRVMQAFNAAQGERDPEKRTERLLEVADMFAEMQEHSRSRDPLRAFYGNQDAQRRAALLARNHRMGMRGRNLISLNRSLARAASPFGGAMGGDVNNNQVVLNFPQNATPDQMADVVLQVLRQQLATGFGQ